jgi:hypothetical protein
MAKTDPHKTHSYSHDYNLMVAFIHEVSRLKIKTDRNNEMAIVEQYLEQRVREIKDRWK